MAVPGKTVGLTNEAAFVFAGTAAAIAAAVLVGEFMLPIEDHQQRGPMSLLFLLIVVCASVLHGTALGLYTTFLSALALDFFFIPPKYSFAIADPLEIFAFIAFAGVSIFVAQLAGRLKAREAAQKEQLRVMDYLLRVSLRLGAAISVEDICGIAADEGQAIYGKNSVVALARAAHGEIVVRPTINNLMPAEMQVLQDRLKSPLPPLEPPAAWSIFPLSPGKAPIGLLAVEACRLADLKDHEPLLRALVLQVALVMEVRLLQASLGRERTAAENERLRSTFLHAIAHDLRTPLAVIRGNAELLANGFVAPDPRSNAVGRIRSATDNVLEFISYVQTLVREGPGIGPPHILAAHDVEEELRRIQNLMTPYVVANPLQFRAEGPIPKCLLSPHLFEHIIVNLIENASRASPPLAPISIHLSSEPGHVVVEVRDEGTGIEAPDIDLIFERYRKGKSSTGSGLGLTIARGFAEQMCAQIEAHNRTDTAGARVILRLQAAAAAGAENNEPQP